MREVAELLSSPNAPDGSSHPSVQLHRAVGASSVAKWILMRMHWRAPTAGAVRLSAGVLMPTFFLLVRPDAPVRDVLSDAIRVVLRANARE